MLLVVTNKQDPHADEVIRRMVKRALPIFRLNTEDILLKYNFWLRIEPDNPKAKGQTHPGGARAARRTTSSRAARERAWHGVWDGSITDEIGRTLRLEAVRVAWIRRPEFLFEGTTDGVQKFIVSEVRALIANLYSLPHISFVNEVFDADRAKTKFQQLIYATNHGIKVPRTIITNSPEEARTFADRAKGDLLVKVLQTGNVERGSVKQGLPSKKISRQAFMEIYPLVKNAPAQIQDYIEKHYELRVTVVGEKVFAVKIESQLHEATKIDWRPRTALSPHSIATIPHAIAEFCRTFVKDQCLLYGAMDFIVEPDGTYVFLENNPSGQYLWLEHETGIPITDALVDLIAERMESSAS